MCGKCLLALPALWSDSVPVSVTSPMCEHTPARSRRQRRCDSHTQSVSQSQKGPPSFLCDCVHTHAVTVTRSKWPEPLQTSHMQHVHAPGPSGGAGRHAQSHGHSEDRWPVVTQCVSACKFTGTQTHIALAVWSLHPGTQLHTHSRAVTIHTVCDCVR